MKQAIRAASILLFSLGIAGFSARVMAETNYLLEAQKRIKLSQTVQPLGPNPFGESINLYTGDVSFAQTDILLAGIGPDLLITREFEQLDRLGEKTPQQNSGFGDWRLVIPHIETLTPGNAGAMTFIGEWKVSVSNSLDGSYARCSYFGPMWSPIAGYVNTPHFGGLDAFEWWRGYQLIIPGEGRREIMRGRTSNQIKPSYGDFPGVTTDHWQIGCLANTTNGQPGEGFVVLAPDGRKYFMTHLIYSDYDGVRYEDPFDPGPHPYFSRLTRKIARMYASKVEDRFGNYVTYDYSGEKLIGMSSSDLRSVAITWWPDAPVIKTITLQQASTLPRVWSYNYADRTSGNPRLSQVVRPDGSSWEYGFSQIRAAANPVTPANSCWDRVNNNNAAFPLYGFPQEGVVSSATIKSPSGLYGEFSFVWRINGQSYLPSYCGQAPSIVEDGNPYFSSLALTRKRLSGAGVRTLDWSYAYEPAHASLQRFCPQPNSCQKTSYTDVVDPSGTKTRYTHSTRWDALEGKLLKTEFGIVGTTAQRVETLEYYLPNGDRPSQSPFGNAMQYGSTNLAKIENNTPVQKSVIVQNGVRFSTASTAFDIYFRPTTVTKESSASP